MKHTNQELITSLRRMLVETKIVIPYGMARIATEIDDLLLAVEEGRLVITEPAEERTE